MNQQYTILVVDDEATIRKTLELQLKTRGYGVITAATGIEALSVLKTNAIDLVLLDIHMPGMTGDEVLKAVRRKYTALELPVLVLTSEEGTGDMVSAFDHGANDYLIKPSDILIIGARIETQLSLKGMNAALLEKQSDLRQDMLQAKVAAQMDKADLNKEIQSRMEAEKALVRSEQRFKVLYDNTPAMYFSLDLDGGILSVNRYGAYILGYQRAELVGRNILELYTQEDRDTVRDYLEKVARDPGHLYRWQFAKLDKHGNTILIRETAKLVESTTGERNILLVGVDVYEDGSPSP